MCIVCIAVSQQSFWQYIPFLSAFFCISYTHNTFNCIVSAVWFHLNHHYIPPGCKLHMPKSKGNKPCGGSHTLSGPNTTPTLLIVLENLHLVGCFYVNMQHNHWLSYPSGATGSLVWVPSRPRGPSYPQGTFLLRAASIKPALNSTLIEMY